MTALAASLGLGPIRLMPVTIQDREGRIFLEARICKTEPALVEDGAAVGTNEANMTTAFTQSDVFVQVCEHDCQLRRRKTIT